MDSFWTPLLLMLLPLGLSLLSSGVAILHHLHLLLIDIDYFWKFITKKGSIDREMEGEILLYLGGVLCI